MTKNLVCWLETIAHQNPYPGSGHSSSYYSLLCSSKFLPRLQSTLSKLHYRVNKICYRIEILWCYRSEVRKYIFSNRGSQGVLTSVGHVCHYHNSTGICFISLKCAFSQYYYYFPLAKNPTTSFAIVGSL